MDKKLILNLGCGLDKFKDCVNVDVYAVVEPDMIYDLNVYPWPWESNSVDGIVMYHILEHMLDVSAALSECARVLKPGGVLDVKVPHCSHDLALGDRCHRRLINDYTFSRGSTVSGEDILDKCAVFKIVSAKTLFDKDFKWMLRMPRCVKNFAIYHLRNVARESQYVLRKMVSNIALTFDDGPSEYTTQILDKLDAIGVKATFFMLGENIRKFPDIVREVHKRGHVIGVHGNTHARWTSQDIVAEEVSKCKDALFDVLPELEPEYYRAPFIQGYARKFPKLLQVHCLKGMCCVDYTVSCQDWLKETTLEQMLAYNTRLIVDGGTILLHDGYPSGSTFKDRSKVVSVILPIYTALSGRHFKFVTLKELENGSCTLPKGSLSGV